jgi:hypothetical protein
MTAMLGRGCHRATLALAWWFCFFALPVSSAFGQASTDDLWAQAQEAQLAQSAAWRALLHYPKDGSHSLIDDPKFFLASNGQIDPQAELRAAINAFSASPSTPSDDSAQCRFIARYRWLLQNLPLAKTRFATADCPQWQALRARIKPDSVTLVFPDGHLNSPASMFGHTLLRIDQPNAQPLLGYAVNYAALTDESNGFAFAYNGITGKYKGYYSLLPYPEKLREYRFTEQRDIWEYRLTFSPQESELLLEHSWELRNIFSYYYFFDKNCSYKLLAMIEAVRPQLNLLSAPGVAVIPTDTIRALKDGGLIAQHVYRPSHVSVLNRMQAAQTSEELQAVQNIVDLKLDKKLLSLPPEADRKRLVYDTAAEYLQYQLSRGDIKLDAFRPRYLEVLTARSQLGGASMDWKQAPPEPTTSHASHRLSLGYVSQDKANAITLRMRPAYHALEDRPQGFLSGSAISFVDAGVRIDESKQHVRLDSLQLLQIDSLAARSTLVRPLSWRLSLGIQPRRLLVYDDRYRAVLDGGAGYTYTLGSLNTQQLMLYGLAQARVASASDKTPNLSLGMRLGARWLPSAQWGVTLMTEAWQPLRRSQEREAMVQLDLAWYAATDRAFHLNVKAAPGMAGTKPELGLRHNWFY